MPGLRGYSLQQEVDTEIVSAYAAASQSFPAVAAAPGWFVLGSFFLPKTVKTRLEFIGNLSSASISGEVKIVDSTTGLDVSGSLIAFTLLTEVRYLSGVFEVLGQTPYSIVAQATGAAGGDKFFSVRTASLVGP
jgi:hypothetical protein